VQLTPKAGQHYLVVCAACTYASAEFCGKRDTPAVACGKAIEAFRKAGWHVDALGSVREKWYCPSCARRAHL
jgi:hypothetical protein